MIKHRFLLLSFFFCFTFLGAQVNSLSSSELLLQIKKLNTLGKVLYIAAHPDDENTRLLAYLANEKKFRTAYLSITRGDGGQNLIGKEQGAALGVLRTQELLAARKVDKAEQFFTRAVDFGYSKLAEETFVFWDRRSVLSDVVYIIRTFQPDVIICRFPTTGEGGHGHHTASALLAAEAFEAAADPKQFPEQLNETSVWKTKRLFWNTFNFGNTNTTSPQQLQIDVGVYNALLGKNYGEIASESRSCHKSQGFGVARQRGKNIEFFKQLKGDSVSKDPFEALSTSWNQLPGGEAIQNNLDQCIREFKVEAPEASVPLLVTIYKQIAALDETKPQVLYWKKQKLKELESILLSCAGLWLEVSCSDYKGLPGEEVNFTTQIIKRSDAPVSLNSLRFLKQNDTLCNLPLEQNQLYSFKRKETLSGELPYTSPYWLNRIAEQNYRALPEAPSPTQVDFQLDVGGLALSVQRDLIYKSTDPVKGEVYRPFEILPALTVNCKEKAVVFMNGNSKTLLFTIKANRAYLKGQLSVNTSEGWTCKIQHPEFLLEKSGDEVTVEVLVECGKNMKEGQLYAKVSCEGQNYNLEVQRIEYDHVPYQFILSPATVKLINTEVKTKAMNIAYIDGAGDEIPQALKQLGYEVTVLSDEQLSKSDLSVYPAIVTGVRAYNSNKRLQVHYPKLMDYVKSGGNLIVQYNTNNNLGQLKTNIGPYPFTISRDRVTDEKAQVKFSDAKLPVFSYPNTITTADFENWVQERGIYFATDIDSNYVAPLSMSDPGENPKNGSLIIGAYGKGNFVYTGLAFFRQLPAGVPGAYRLFVNLLHLPKH
ncbi:MAG: PIG-L family deacetylase [Bacteroidia bacterium]|nr:PIG-L family deacetylase [Bacteroidia bacterium]